MSKLQLATNIKTAVIDTIVADKPNLKISDKLEAAIADAIASLLPAQASRLADSQRAMINNIVGCDAGVLLDTLSDDITIHIPACRRADKNGMDMTAPLMPAQRVTFTLASYDDASVRYFALALKACWSRLNFDKSQDELDNLYRYKLVTEALPILAGDTALKQANKGKDYPAIVRDFGLVFLFDYPGIEYDNHTTGEGKTKIGITAILPNTDILDKFESALLPTTHKNQFSYITAGKRWDVVAKDVTESRKVVAVRYAFSLSI